MAEFDPTPEGPEGDHVSWSASAGTLADLIRRDLFDPETPTPMRRLALDLAAPVLRDRLDRIEASLGTVEQVTVTVRRRGEIIGVTRDGHDPERFAAVERRIEQAFPLAEPSKSLAAAMAAGLGLVAVLMLVWGHWFVAVLFAAAVVIPIGTYRSCISKDKKAHLRRDEQRAEVRAALVKARNDAEDQERTDAERDLAVRRALDDRREALPAEPVPDTLSR